jgi:hypothetical protein
VTSCGTCGRALAACEWCGSADLLTDAAGTWPVTRAPGWDGAFHQPCQAAHQAVLDQAARSPSW